MNNNKKVKANQCGAVSVACVASYWGQRSLYLSMKRTSDLLLQTEDDSHGLVQDQ